MIKVLLINLLLINSLFASPKIYNAYALTISDENGKKENIQNKRETDSDFNGNCLVEIFVNTKYKIEIPKVTIGTAIGHFKSSKSVYKNKIKVGEIMVFKLYNIRKGYLKITIYDKLYDMKTFIK
ncbi:hypothetical protein [Halarcobacter bivalviorum]|uniref:hypothetical protein n=1 Tax=Halarcobacter bivalviorum TaxID=663364 RepID=UPI00100B3C4B|nr:hypothetical protein [Halarcobacter bivalviorum]RXK04159.1 hypothetical protein CRU97_11140 [Halarcobacter bivalviorum]